MRIIRATAIAAIGLVASLAPAQAAMAGTSQAALGQAGSRHLPYTDPNQAGWLTLCGTNLKPITHGNISTKPFVWRVVSNVHTPQGWWKAGAKAVLFAYQPRPYTPAGAWSGSQMAGSSFYSNPAHPMAQMTPIDEPLSYMTIAFPPIWDHLIELRLYLGAPNTPEDTTGYAAADIQVAGDTWTLVAGGHSSCTAGKALAEEAAIHMPGASGTPTPSPSPSRSASGGGSGNGAGTGSAGSGGSSGAGSGSGSGNASAASHSSMSGLAVAGIAMVVGLAVIIPVGIWLGRKRRVTG